MSIQLNIPQNTFFILFFKQQLRVFSFIANAIALTWCYKHDKAQKLRKIKYSSYIFLVISGAAEHRALPQNRYRIVED